jgi:hypothetical protein
MQLYLAAASSRLQREDGDSEGENRPWAAGVRIGVRADAERASCIHPRGFPFPFQRFESFMPAIATARTGAATSVQPGRHAEATDAEPMNDARRRMMSKPGSGRSRGAAMGGAACFAVVMTVAVLGLGSAGGCSTVRTQSSAFDFRRVVVQPTDAATREPRQPTVASAGRARTLGGE